MLPNSTIIIMVVIAMITYVQSDCRKTFIYHPKYYYGYEIFCSHTSSLELSTTMATNAISLNIVNSNITFDNTTFKYLKKIRQLNITNAQIHFDVGKTIPQTKSMNIFKSLTQIETLIIQNCNITSEGISHLLLLDSLVTLKLDNDSIDNFPSETFKQLRNLNTLSLNHNRIKRIDDLALCDLINLRQLYLSDNLITELKYDDIKCLNQLKVLNLSGNALTKLHGISSTSLTFLSVASNQIDCIEKIDAPNLTTLDMSANKLTNVSIDHLNSLKSLIKLDLSNNNLTSVMLTNELLNYLDLSHNKLRNVPKLNLGLLKKVVLNHNEIRSINSSDLLQMKSLESFEVTNNNLTDIDCHSFANIVNITVLDLSRNSIGNITLIFVKNSTLPVLNISHNNFESMSNNWFTNLTKLKHLDVSFNKLTSLNDSTFKTLENLETLNMSHNLLTQLDYKLLEPLENLIVLDVDNNMIQEIDYGSIVSELPNLDAFQVKNNLLTCEFLTKMIHYFKDNDITFSLNEHLDYDKENVEGIYCKETRNKLLDMKKTEEALQNNTKMLNALYSIYSHDSGGLTVRGSGFDETHSYSITGGEIAASVLSLISLVVVITLGVHKVVLWHRRRKYLVDELELITNEPYKRLG